MHKYDFEGYQDKAHASYHFYNVVMNRRVISRLENILSNLKQMLPYWEKRAETKTQGGSQALLHEEEQEKKHAQDAVDVFGRLKGTINDEFNPAFEEFFADFKQDVFNEDTFERLSKVIKGVGVTTWSTFYMQVSKLKVALSHINNAYAFDKQKLEDMFVYIDDFINKIYKAVGSMRGTKFGDKLESLINDVHFYVLVDVKKKLQNLVDQVTEQPEGGEGVQVGSWIHS